MALSLVNKHACPRPQANAESLAGALRNIIEARRVQQNFQLIVITHDERCATTLAACICHPAGHVPTAGSAILRVM